MRRRNNHNGIFCSNIFFSWETSFQKTVLMHTDTQWSRTIEWKFRTMPSGEIYTEWTLKCKLVFYKKQCESCIGTKNVAFRKEFLNKKMLVFWKNDYAVFSSGFVQFTLVFVLSLHIKEYSNLNEILKRFKNISKSLIHNCYSKTSKINISL